MTPKRNSGCDDLNRSGRCFFVFERASTRFRCIAPAATPQATTAGALRDNSRIAVNNIDLGKPKGITLFKTLEALKIRFENNARAFDWASCLAFLGFRFPGLSIFADGTHTAQRTSRVPRTQCLPLTYQPSMVLHFLEPLELRCNATSKE